MHKPNPSVFLPIAMRLFFITFFLFYKVNDYARYRHVGRR